MAARRKLKLDNQGQVEFFEDSASGTNKIAVKAPATLAADVTLTLPTTDGAASQFLQTDGSGTLSWATGTSTLESAYENDSTLHTDVVNGPVKITASMFSTQDCLQITQESVTTGICLKILQQGSGFAITINGIAMTTGSGSPENVLSAPVGSIYLRTDGGAGTTLYVKQSGTGNTGWAGK